ncbi:energy-coupling factor ABC transporter ATP-binding protein [Roseburia sp. MSJ-14]|uniref:energy-coupling factor ABC transporter ATP-binding protein n=1 Tax=Roseburia sp. MSJ-14 TaxID=2841514 RepID=UPI001C0F4546|nr:ABC transporter ATP-binding protein [Roseburia sp. MSJ-14]MBU5473026.1 energy-coupling factor ABC transporter ATP-binding protein [Roseburia sp. MSJ-14]
MAEEIIKIENLAYAYQTGTHALAHIDMTVREGEKIAVMGSNGAGKSTFFLNLNGVLQPDEGTIAYRGKAIGKKDLNELRKNVGFVFQDADSQMIASDVQGEISFGPMNLKLPREEVKKRVDEAIEYMNLNEYRNRPPHYLSGGEKKRVSIADIIAMKSEVVLFDEPTAALDPLSAEMLEEVLAKMSAEGKTLLISTHDVDFAYRWAERIVVFCGGKIIADGTPLEIFQNKEVLKQAHLKKPAMFTVYETLVEKGLVEDGSYPRVPEELKGVLK